MNSKVILVADGLSPVGKAVVEMLSNGGHIVYFGCDPALSTVPTIGSATALKLDLTSRNHISKAITQILKTNGRLDVLAVNLAGSLYGGLEVVTPCSVEEHLNRSLIGLARLQRAVLPTMRAQDSGSIYTIVAKFGAADVPLQAFERLVEFWPLLEAEHGMLRVDQDQATLTFDLATASNLVQVHASIQMVQFVALIRQAIGTDIVPERVTFRQISSTARRHACEDFFGTSIAVDADSSLQFSAEDMTRPFNRFDRHIWHGIEQELRTRLSAMTDKMQFSDHVVRAIEAGLPYGQATLAAVAVKLAIGQRSLQRRLREEGVSFASLRDKTHLRLARQFLKTSPQSKTQIAYRLGFHDPNSFFRRYRQWVRDGKLKSD